METADSTSPEADQESQTPDTVTITSLNGNGEMFELEVPYNPERIAILDMASMDILDNLGVGDRIVGSASTSLFWICPLRGTSLPSLIIYGRFSFPMAAY